MMRVSTWLMVFALLPLQALAADITWSIGGGKSKGFDPDDADPAVAEGIQGMAQGIGLRYAIFVAVIIAFVIISKAFIARMKKKNKEDDEKYK